MAEKQYKKVGNKLYIYPDTELETSWINGSEAFPADTELYINVTAFQKVVAEYPDNKEHIHEYDYFLLCVHQPEWMPDSGSADPEIAWSASTATATIGETNTYPTLSNPNSLDVTYSSSQTDYATIDADTGVVTLVAAGTTVISASFAGDEEYASSTVTYTLTVAPELAASVYIDKASNMNYIESSKYNWNHILYDYTDGAVIGYGEQSIKKNHKIGVVRLDADAQHAAPNDYTAYMYYATPEKQPEATYYDPYNYTEIAPAGGTSYRIDDVTNDVHGQGWFVELTSNMISDGSFIFFTAADHHNVSILDFVTEDQSILDNIELAHDNVKYPVYIPTNPSAHGNFALKVPNGIELQFPAPVGTNSYSVARHGQPLVDSTSWNASTYVYCFDNEVTPLFENVMFYAQPVTLRVDNADIYNAYFTINDDPTQYTDRQDVPINALINFYCPKSENGKLVYDDTLAPVKQDYDGENYVYTFRVRNDEFVSVEPRNSAGIDWESNYIETTIGGSPALPPLRNPNNVSPITIKSTNTDVATIVNGNLVLSGTAGESIIVAYYEVDGYYDYTATSLNLRVHDHYNMNFVTNDTTSSYTVANTRSGVVLIEGTQQVRIGDVIKLQANEGDAVKFYLLHGRNNTYVELPQTSEQQSSTVYISVTIPESLDPAYDYLVVTGGSESLYKITSNFSSVLKYGSSYNNNWYFVQPVLNKFEAYFPENKYFGMPNTAAGLTYVISPYIPQQVISTSIIAAEMPAQAITITQTNHVQRLYIQDTSKIGDSSSGEELYVFSGSTETTPYPAPKTQSDLTSEVGTYKGVSYNGYIDIPVGNRVSIKNEVGWQIFGPDITYDSSTGAYSLYNVEMDNTVLGSSPGWGFNMPSQATLIGFQEP